MLFVICVINSYNKNQRGALVLNFIW